MTDVAQAFQRLAHGGRGVSLHGGHELGLHLDDGLLDLFEREHLAPWAFDDMHVGVAAFGDLLEQHAETSGAADQHRVSGRDHRHERRLDGGTGGAVHHHGLSIVRFEDGAQHRLHLTHGLEHIRVELADRRLAHRGQHAGIHVGRTWGHEQTVRRIQRFDARGCLGGICCCCHCRSSPVVFGIACGLCLCRDD